MRSYLTGGSSLFAFQSGGLCRYGALLSKEQAEYHHREGKGNHEGSAARNQKTAVTVSPTLEQVKLIEEAGFDVLQIHGYLAEEIPEEADIPIIRAVNVKGRVPVMESYPRIFAYLFDAAAPGSGKSFDWSCLEQIPAEGRKFILAGGLHPCNVGEAIRQVHPWMVDVSSGVEYDDKKGKDPVKIQAFIEAVKEADEKSS